MAGLIEHDLYLAERVARWPAAPEPDGPALGVVQVVDGRRGASAWAPSRPARSAGGSPGPGRRPAIPGRCARRRTRRWSPRPRRPTSPPSGQGDRIGAVQRDRRQAGQRHARRPKPGRSASAAVGLPRATAGGAGAELPGDDHRVERLGAGARRSAHAVRVSGASRTATTPPVAAVRKADRSEPVMMPALPSDIPHRRFGDATEHSADHRHGDEQAEDRRGPPADAPKSRWKKGEAAPKAFVRSTATTTGRTMKTAAT